MWKCITLPVNYTLNLMSVAHESRSYYCESSLSVILWFAFLNVYESILRIIHRMKYRMLYNYRLIAYSRNWLRSKILIWKCRSSSFLIIIDQSWRKILRRLYELKSITVLIYHVLLIFSSDNIASYYYSIDFIFSLVSHVHVQCKLQQSVTIVTNWLITENIKCTSCSASIGYHCNWMYNN